jgi:hypothetical protein
MDSTDSLTGEATAAATNREQRKRVGNFIMNGDTGRF